MSIQMRGAEVAKAMKEKLIREREELNAAGVNPCLTIIRVGAKENDLAYERGAKKRMEMIGIECRIVELPEDISQQELENVVQQQNEDDTVDGILVQLPLPKHLNEQAVIDKISPLKDVDGLHPVNAGALLTNRSGFIPCTPKGVMAMLESIGLDDLSGMNAVVLGRSNLVGKPLALLLQNKNATVTIVHSKTKDIKTITSKADILVAAIGQPKMVKSDWVKDGAVVIDVGINRMENGKLCGDVDFDDVCDKVKAISPVPKGVGPMTVCC